MPYKSMPDKLMLNKLMLNTHTINLLIKVGFLGLALSLLSSCSIFETSDNSLEPTELEDIEEIATIEHKWSFSHGNGTDGALVKLSPVVKEKTIFIIDRNASLAALERESGRQLWQKQFDVTITSGLAFIDDILFFSDDKAFLYAVSAKDGSLIWKQKFSSISL